MIRQIRSPIDGRHKERQSSHIIRPDLGHMTASWSGVRRLWDRRGEPGKILGQEHVRDIKHKPKSNGSCRHKHKTRCDAGKSLAPSRVPYLYPHSIILDHSADVFSYLSLVVGGEGGGGEAGAAVAPSCLRPGFQLQTCLPLVSLAFPLFFFSSSSSPFRLFPLPLLNPYLLYPLYLFSCNCVLRVHCRLKADFLKLLSWCLRRQKKMARS